MRLLPQGGDTIGEWAHHHDLSLWPSGFENAYPLQSALPGLYLQWTSVPGRPAGYAEDRYV